MSKIKTNLIFAAIAVLVITGLQMYSIFHTPSARIENEYSYIYDNIATAKQLDPSISQPFINIAYAALEDNDVSFKEHALLTDSYKIMVANRDFMMQQEIKEQTP